jgi:signal transduction histidine kinase
LKKADVKNHRLAGWAYSGLLGLAAFIGLAVSWTPPGREIDHYAYDFFFRLHDPPEWPLGSIILGIDERTMRDYGGVGGIRVALARGLELIAPAHPKAVAVDIILAEPGTGDPALEQAFRNTPNLVLSSDLLPEGQWDDPIPRFRALAVSIGQVHAALDRYDAINREVPLEKVGGHDRRWALGLEAFRASRNASGHARITESPDDVEVDGVSIPCKREDGCVMRIRYAPPTRGGIPSYSVADLEHDPTLISKFAGKVVFAGVTAQTAQRDRWVTPYGAYIGVAINANVYETIANRLFLTDAPDSLVLAWCAVLVLCAGLTFWFVSGRAANAIAVLLLALAHVVPYIAFTRGAVFPYMPGVLCAWLAAVSAAAWRHLITRRQLIRAEASTSRYQRAMQFVTHEMRTPLTAIQGSSELITRYALPDEKRKQIAGMINSESKRLAQMIETFLNVERVSGGRMELKRERFSAPELIEQCINRARPLADRKNIAIASDSVPDADLTGDRELMEYAVYNLLTNAIKYSPVDTRVTISGGSARGETRLWVEDQGIGMDKREIKRVFERFYRTQKAEQTGEAGSGIGLSIVEQIVAEHGGSILVDSTPGRGSRFTLVLPNL